MKIKNNFNIYILLLSISIPRSELFAQASECVDGFDCSKSQPKTLVNTKGCSTENADYTLIFEDNFDGQKLDENFWKKADKPNSSTLDDSKTKQWLAPDNVIVDGGYLKIISKEENVHRTWWGGGESDFRFTSGRVDSKYSFAWSHGKFEARIKIPKGVGTFPAFWLVARHPDEWNEIDIFEFMNNNYEKMEMTVHHDFPGNDVKCMCNEHLLNDDFRNDFHVYGVEWNYFFIRWYLDGVAVHTMYRHFKLDGTPMIDCDFKTGVLVNSIKAFPDRPMDIVFSTWINSAKTTFEPKQNADDFPCEMLIDWVKVYYKYPCNDIKITDCSDFTPQPTLYNVLYGKNITFDCDYTLPSGYFLKLIGENIDIRKTKNMISPQDAICQIQTQKFNCGTIVPRLTNSTNTVDDAIIFPNPTKDSLSIYWEKFQNETMHFEIFSSIGAKVVSGKLTIGNPISVRDLKNGIYDIKIYKYDIQKFDVKTFKFIKE
jgi:beta-glucanase (GH16 family)